MITLPAEFSRGITLPYIQKILNCIEILGNNSILIKNIPYLT
jgi:hypothetical protein